MVKNQKGGNKAKRQGRKHVQASGNFVARTRFSTDPDEIYAFCTKLLGNGMCHVKCIDGNDRLCFIRKKFTGRGKKDNTVAGGTWLLVGRRSFEKAQAGKLEKCDLLEVYNSHDQKQIKQKELRFLDRWSIFDGGIDHKNKNELKINENVSSLDFGEDSDDDDYFTNPNPNRVVNNNNNNEVDDVVEVEDI
jgi:initiation factor 1A